MGRGIVILVMVLLGAALAGIKFGAFFAGVEWGYDHFFGGGVLAETPKEWLDRYFVPWFWVCSWASIFVGVIWGGLIWLTDTPSVRKEDV